MNEFALMVLGILLIAVMHELGHVLMAIALGYFKKLDLKFLNFRTVLNYPVPLISYIEINLSGIIFGILAAIYFSNVFFAENVLADFFFCFIAIFLSLADVLLLALVYRQKEINPFFSQVPERFSWNVRFLDG